MQALQEALPKDVGRIITISSVKEHPAISENGTIITITIGERGHELLLSDIVLSSSNAETLFAAKTIDMANWLSLMVHAGVTLKSFEETEPNNYVTWTQLPKR